MYRDVEDAYFKVCEYNKATSWKKLQKKAKMLGLEIQCLMEIYKDFQNIVDLKLKAESKKIKLIREIDSLEKSSQLTVGFFKKKSKAEKISDLNNTLKQTKDRIELFKRLIMASSEILMNSQLDIIKKQKQERFKVMMDIFAKDQLSNIEKERHLWKVVLESNKKLILLDDESLT